MHAWLADRLPEAAALALDVGAGAGRDAAWLADCGCEVVAAEPSDAMRAEAQHLHPEGSIRWLADSLPSLQHTLRLNLSFDLILLSAVWMHVPSRDRARAFRKLITLLKPGGLIAITLRDVSAEPERGIHPVSQAEIERLARKHGAFVESATESPDKLGRDDVRWIQLAIRLPDDSSGALPLLRHIILNDDKSSTYKLALLRVLCRIADSAAGYARDVDDEYVAVPLGLLGLYWMRLFMPLLAQGLPQSPRNQGYDQLGFVKNGFRSLTDMSQLDLRIGLMFGEVRSHALRDACATIAQMPAHYMTYANSAPVLPVLRAGRLRRPNSICLDDAY